ncbi:MAG: LTA synthase family protein [Eubacteriales bacterium]|nr:LTA synthase family protein [Eubacteriales bacterium]
MLRVFAFLAENPGAFVYNGLLIFSTLSITFFFKRKFFMYLVICCFWLALGITNGIILSFRMTPFTVSDLALLENGLSILPNYMSTLEIILTALVILVALAGFVLTFLFAPKYKGKLHFLTSLLILGVLATSLYGMNKVGISERWLSNYFSNLGYAYEDYGVPYCFVNTWLNRGIDAPEGYSEAMILGLFEEGIPEGIPEANNALKINDEVSADAEDLPNIIFVQLESFFDASLIKGLEYSTDPIPNFHALQEENSTGYIRVPAFGAGTANTEFEILTGMRIMSFGPGEYPYKTIVKDRTCESVNYVLKKSGYTSHAIHNHRGQFYGRNEVYSKLGFDSFTSLEYMNNVKKTPKNWSKDDVLTGEILAALSSTETRDFVFTVSVQGHGEYPEKKTIEDEDLDVRITNEIDNDKYKNKVEYYLQQAYEMDAFVGDLVAAIQEIKEPTVVVFYGDHLPVLELSEEKMKNNSVYDTEYLIASNYNLRKKDKDISAYQLYSEVLDRVGIHNGILTWYHQTRKDYGNYLDNLESLEYDMLYGENYVYGGMDPFISSTLHMGIREIVVEKIFNFGESTYVVGQNFTPYSKVAVNGDFVDTVFVNSKILRVPDEIKSSDPNEFSISQVGKYNAVLSTLLTDVE